MCVSCVYVHPVLFGLVAERAKCVCAGGGRLEKETNETSRPLCAQVSRLPCFRTPCSSAVVAYLPCNPSGFVGVVENPAVGFALQRICALNVVSTEEPVPTTMPRPCEKQPARMYSTTPSSRSTQSSVRSYYPAACLIGSAIIFFPLLGSSALFKAASWFTIYIVAG